MIFSSAWQNLGPLSLSQIWRSKGRRQRSQNVRPWTQLHLTLIPLRQRANHKPANLLLQPVRVSQDHLKVKVWQHVWLFVCRMAKFKFYGLPVCSTASILCSVQPPFLLYHPASVLLSLESPHLEVCPSVEVGSSADIGPNGELSRCRACGAGVPHDALLQGKFCSSICAQPSSGRYTHSLYSLTYVCYHSDYLDMVFDNEANVYFL